MYISKPGREIIQELRRCRWKEVDGEGVQVSEVGRESEVWVHFEQRVNNPNGIAVEGLGPTIPPPLPFAAAWNCKAGLEALSDSAVSSTYNIRAPPAGERSRPLRVSPLRSKPCFSAPLPPITLTPFHHPHLRSAAKARGRGIACQGWTFKWIND